MSKFGAIVVLAWLGVMGFAVSPAAAESNGCKLHPSLVAAFVSGQDIPESVTTDHEGNLYVSLGNTIQRRTPGGPFSLYATLPLPINALGVKIGPDGCLYNVSTSLSEVPGAFVWRICAANSVEVFAELDPLGAPNDLAFDDAGELFVTDPVLGQIWKVDALGTARVFVKHPLLAGNPDDPALIFRALGANGIALDRQQRALYVSNTDQGSVLRVDLRADDHTPRVFAKDSRLRGADGIAFDREGTLFVAVNGADALVSVSKYGALSVLAQGGLLDAPSSVAFGATGRDRYSAYIMSSAFSRTLGLQPGTPHPALLSARVSVPGLPLF